MPFHPHTESSSKMILVFIVLGIALTSKTASAFPKAVNVQDLDVSLKSAEDALVLQFNPAIQQASDTIDNISSDFRATMSTAVKDTFDTYFLPATRKLSDIEHLFADMSIASTYRVPVVANRIRADVSQRIAKIANNRKQGVVAGIVAGASTGITKGLSC